jgi:dTDP-4-dehydrorhamnose 3,5-epimerase
MKDEKINGVLLTQLKIIDTPGGDVLHGMKLDDPGYSGFGEAYLSTVEKGVVKGWKRHRQMTLNLVVPVGSIRFVIYDNRGGSPTCEKFQEVTLSKCNYKRLTIPPMVWIAFQGVGDVENMLLNIASIRHEPNEADRKSLEEIAFIW